MWFQRAERAHLLRLRYVIDGVVLTQMVVKLRFRNLRVPHTMQKFINFLVRFCIGLAF